MSGESFRDERDYEGFLDRMGRCSQRFGLRVFAYVFMGNHYHLPVKTREANLSRSRQWLVLNPIRVAGFARSLTNLALLW